VPGTLYLIATPIGNLDDLSPRAAEVLRTVRTVAAEDTRRTRKLYAHLGARAPAMVSLPAFGERERMGAILERLAAGEDVALCTDAGTPAVLERRLGQGRVLLWAVAVYGMATIVFGLSKSFWITFTALALTGTADMVSMVIRSTVRQLLTPDAMRGRMVSWNMLFFARGPQLGEVEAGLLARWVGPVISVVVGGLGCLVAAGSVAWWTPELRRFEGHEPGPHENPPAGRASAAHPAR